MIEKRLLTGDEVDITFFIKPHPFPDIFDITTTYLSENRFRITVTRKDLDTGWGVPLELAGVLHDGQKIIVRVGPSPKNTKILENNTKIQVRKIRRTLKGDIPKRVFQIHQENVPTYILTKSICSWKQIHHDHEYYLCEKNTSDPLQKYKLIHKYGGMYSASPNICKSFIASKIKSGKEGVVVHTGDKKTFRNDFFMFKAGHPLLADFLHSVENSTDEKYISTKWNEIVLKFIRSQRDCLEIIHNKNFQDKLVHTFPVSRFLKDTNKEASDPPLEVYEKTEKSEKSEKTENPDSLPVNKTHTLQVQEEIKQVEEVEELEELEEVEEVEEMEEVEEVEIEVEVEVDENGNEIEKVAFSDKDAQEEILKDQQYQENEVSSSENVTQVKST